MNMNIKNIDKNEQLTDLGRSLSSPTIFIENFESFF